MSNDQIKLYFLSIASLFFKKINNCFREWWLASKISSFGCKDKNVTMIQVATVHNRVVYYYIYINISNLYRVTSNEMNIRQSDNGAC